MTAIAIYNQKGHFIGRCDTRCHDASSSDCDCCCRGRLHGVGSHEVLWANKQSLLTLTLSPAIAEPNQGMLW